MYNVTMFSGWLGSGVADLARIGGPATAVARRRHRQVVFAGSGTATRRPGVQQLA